jgi:hypothetical protein
LYSITWSSTTKPSFSSWMGSLVGLIPSQLVLEIYHDNTVLPWSLLLGVGVLDTQITSGQVYFDTLPTGSYGVRWRPNSTGYWRLMLSYSAGYQILAQDYDVNSGTGVAAPGGGLKVSFVGPVGKNDC